MLVRFSSVRSGLRVQDDFQIVSESGAEVAEDEREAVVDWVGDKMIVWSFEDFEAEAVWDS